MCHPLVFALLFNRTVVVNFNVRWLVLDWLGGTCFCFLVAPPATTCPIPSLMCWGVFAALGCRFPSPFLVKTRLSLMIDLCSMRKLDPSIDMNPHVCQAGWQKEM